MQILDPGWQPYKGSTGHRIEDGAFAAGVPAESVAVARMTETSTRYSAGGSALVLQWDGEDSPGTCR